MNKQIQLLAEQAGITYKQNLGVYQFYTNELEEFSKLIAKECLMLADNIRNECDVDDEPQQALGAAWVALAITRHFGLEP